MLVSPLVPLEPFLCPLPPQSKLPQMDKETSSGRTVALSSRLIPERDAVNVALCPLCYNPAHIQSWASFQNHSVLSKQYAWVGYSSRAKHSANDRFLATLITLFSLSHKPEEEEPIPTHSREHPKPISCWGIQIAMLSTRQKLYLLIFKLCSQTGGCNTICTNGRLCWLMIFSRTGGCGGGVLRL